MFSGAQTKGGRKGEESLAVNTFTTQHPPNNIGRPTNNPLFVGNIKNEVFIFQPFLLHMMANFQIGASLPEDDEDDEVGTKERRQSLRKKRHYKKDSRFLLDLYTLTFDEDESVDEIATTCQVSEELTSFSTPSSPSPSRSSSVIRSMTSAPPPAASVQPLMSLNFSERPALLQRKSIPSLETNLHKILARKFMDSEDVSFKKAKLLTKAYYQLLRTTSGEDEDVCEIQRGG